MGGLTLHISLFALIFVFTLSFLKKRKGAHLISDPINYFFLQVMGSICANATAVTLFSIIIVKILDNPLL